jgi:hypothetical protein
MQVIYQSVKLFLEKRKITKIRNLYIQADNASANKCWTVIAGLCALIMFGIVRKVHT